MKISLWLLVLLVSIGLAGCLGAPVVRPKDYNPAEDGARIYLSRDHVTKLPDRVGNKQGYLTIKSGYYAHVYNQWDGRLYEGDGRSVIDHNEGRYTFYMKGGIYIPNDKSKPIRYWYRQESLEGVHGNGEPIERTDADIILGLPKTGLVLGPPIDPSIAERLQSNIR